MRLHAIKYNIILMIPFHASKPLKAISICMYVLNMRFKLLILKLHIIGKLLIDLRNILIEKIKV